MGRIDPEKMYSNVQKWNWRNINDGKIYLDEQSKRNAISMRNSLMPLINSICSPRRHHKSHRDARFIVR